MNSNALLNDFAIRCFRDVADHDYIVARMAYRANLLQQFHWSSLQAIEKYLKAILLLNRIKAKDVNHDIEKALLYANKLPFLLQLSESSKEFIRHINRYGRFRYLESSFYIFGPKLVELDKTVWEIRRYCTQINAEIQLHSGQKINIMEYELEKIARSEHERPRLFKLLGGVLEKIVDCNNHPARKALVWQNAFFGSSKLWRRSVTMTVYSQATNSPLTLHPEILEEISQYVYLPKEVKESYRRGNASRLY